MNNRKPLIIIALAVLLCGLLAFRGTKAEEDGQEDDSTIVIDLTKGIWKTPKADYRHASWSYGELMEFLASCNKGYDQGFDLDEDGTGDFTVGNDDNSSSESSWYYCNAYIIPTAKCSISGDYTLTGKIKEKEWKCILRFGEKPSQEEYEITVDGGYAYRFGENGQREKVTSAAPGTQLFLMADAAEDFYVTGWEEDYYSNSCIQEYLKGSFDDRDRNGMAFYMPRADLSFRAIKEPKKPLTVDLTGGGCFLNYSIVGSLGGMERTETCFKQSFGDGYSEKVFDESAEEWEFRRCCYSGNEWSAFTGGEVDVDGDGSKDIHFGVNYYPGGIGRTVYSISLIPLPTCSVSGDYVVKGLNVGPIAPITIRFGEKKTEKEYTVSVKGGHAEDRNGKTVSKAMPGEIIRIVCDGSKDAPLTSDSRDIQADVSGVLFMPAHDISFVFDLPEGFSPTPAPTETPTPTEEFATPTPTSEVATPTPTEEQGITKAATPTIAPTGAEPVKDEAKQVKGEDEEQKGGFNPLYVIIPITVIILGAAIAAYVMMNRKQPAKPAHKETIEEGEDDYE